MLRPYRHCALHLPVSAGNGEGDRTTERCASNGEGDVVVGFLTFFKPRAIEK